MKRRIIMNWAELILGILLAVLGAYTLFNPHIAMRNVVLLYGIITIVYGIADIVFYVRLDKRTGFAPSTLIISGVLNILLGIVLLLNLSLGTWFMTILFPLWFIIHCIGRLINADFVRITAGKGTYWMVVIANVLGIVLGALLLFMPGATTVTFGYLLGGYLLVVGTGSIVSALSRF